MAGPIAFYAPDPIQSCQLIPGSNVPASGALLFIYSVGTSTKQNSYTDASASTARTNPIVLDSGGNIPGNGEVWIVSSAKFVLAPANDTDPPSSPYWTRDSVPGINNITAAQVQALSAQNEWVQGSTATFVGVTAFSLVGDQSSLYTLGRRIKATVTGGDRFGTVSSDVVSGGSTVVGVTLDSGTLNAGLSSVQYGLLSTPNGSIPWTIATSTGLSLITNQITNIAQTSSAFATSTLTVSSTSVFTGTVSTQIASTTYGAPILRGFVNAIATTTPNTSSNVVLMPYTVPANALSNDGQSIRFTFMGATVNNANAKTFNLVFGTGISLSGIFTTSQSSVWRANGEISRSGSSSQRVNLYFAEGTAALTNTAKFAFVAAASAQNDASTLPLQLNFTATTGAGDITQTLSLIEYIK